MCFFNCGNKFYSPFSSLSLLQILYINFLYQFLSLIAEGQLPMYLKIIEYHINTRIVIMALELGHVSCITATYLDLKSRYLQI